MIPLTYEKEAEIPLEYLESNAISELRRRFNLTRDKGLDVLVKSLLFEDSHHFYQNLTSDGFDKYVPSGYFFSEFVLTKQLNLDLKEAYHLKKRLDNFHYYKTGISAGNIKFADLNTIGEYSFKISNGKESRLMFDYPIDFYCRSYNQTFHFSSGASLIDFDCLWCDGFDFLYPQYFSGFEHLKIYAKTILETLLAYNDLVLSDIVVQHWKVENYPLYQYVLDNFQCHQTYRKGKYVGGSHGLFFPSGQSLATRLKLENSDHIVSMESPKWSIGEKLTYFEGKFGLRQKDIAKESGITVRTIRKMEKDEGDPDLYTIRKVCKALSISLEEFFQGIE